MLHVGIPAHYIKIKSKKACTLDVISKYTCSLHVISKNEFEIHLIAPVSRCEVCTSDSEYEVWFDSQNLQLAAGLQDGVVEHLYLVPHQVSKGGGMGKTGLVLCTNRRPE